ncbi:MAG: LPS export ABC transporter periplasmic protein LptC [Muribaculaceae bacterium]|nr:LPS export ABC transporter periplasmic protein LptC [Muribaculaceae bacterium]
MRSLVQIVFLVLSVTAVFTSCKDDSTAVVSHPTNPELVPTMTTSDVQTIISDSGFTRYRITSPLWNMFEEAKRPHWTFPKGVKCEELDNKFNTVTSIQCDSAYFDKDNALWTLTGNVRISNANNDLILTDQMNWDQRNHQMYSDAFIHIEKQGRIIEGYGYVSNERLTTYQLRQVEAIFPIDERRMPHPGSGNSPRRPMQ